MATILEDLTLDYKPYSLYRLPAEKLITNTAFSDSFISSFTGSEEQISVVVDLKENEVQMITPATFLGRSAFAFDGENMKYLNPIRNSRVVEKVLLCANFQQFNDDDTIQLDGFIESEDFDFDAHFKAFRCLINGNLTKYTNLPATIQDLFLPYSGYKPINTSLSTKNEVIVYIDNDVCVAEIADISLFNF
jgi:hypothetical protein